MNNEVAVIIKLCLLKLKVLFPRNLSYSLAKRHWSANHWNTFYMIGTTVMKELQFKKD